MANINLSKEKTQIAHQNPEIRAKNFKEVSLGYSEADAINEAMRCLNCKNFPCVQGCPVKIHIPQFIEKVREGNFEEAYEIISQSSSLPAICGRVCPQEIQCESKCIRGLNGEPVVVIETKNDFKKYREAINEAVDYCELINSTGRYVIKILFKLMQPLIRND